MQTDTATLEDAVKVAYGLRSEDGENPEYDRALVEFLWNLFGLPRRRGAAMTGIDIDVIYPTNKERQTR